MTTFRRPLLDELVHSLTEQVHPRIVALTGPRQTGKTTMIRQALRRVDIPSRYLPVDERLAEHAHRRDEEGDSIRTGWLLDAWQKAREDAERSDRGFVLALDEVQHVKGWSTIVKGQWDRDRWTGCPLRVIVAGSAPWTTLTGLHESLAGRFMPVEARHWSFSEMSAAFDFSVDQYLFFGGYPGTASAVENVEAWRKGVLGTIVAPAIERDIIALTRVDKPPLMRRLMALAARYSGQMLSYNKMLGQLQEAGNTTTLATYLDLLSGAGLVTGLPRYSAKPYLGRASSPKLNVLNTALMTAPLTYSFDEARADRTFWGRLVESGVGAHLANTAGFAVELFSWRDGPHEVDFVLSRGPNLVGIEVRSGPRPARLGGLAEFRKRFPGARTLVVGERGVPLEEFLSQPARYWADNPTPSAAGETGESRSVREPSPGYEPSPAHTPRRSFPGYRDPMLPGREADEDPILRDERIRFMAGVRMDEDVLARGRGSPWLWHLIGRAYMGAMPEHFQDDPIVRLRVRLGEDEGLLASVLAGLPRLVARGDLPSLEEVVRREEEFAKAPPFTDTVPRFTYQILAGMGEIGRLGGDALAGLDADAVARAVGCYYITPYVEEPAWYRRAVRAHPEPCARALVAVHRSLIRRRKDHNNHLFALADDALHAEVARRGVPRLLGVFPTRCSRTQVSALYALLWAAVAHVPPGEFAGRIRRRVAAKGMDVAQRAVWLGAGLIVSPREYRPVVEDFVARGLEPRARHILRFLVPAWRREPAIAEPWVEWDTADIAALVKALGSWYDPWWGGLGSGSRLASPTFSLRVDGLIKRWLMIVAERQDPEAGQALDSLADDPALASWYDVIEEAKTRRRARAIRARHTV